MPTVTVKRPPWPSYVDFIGVNLCLCGPKTDNDFHKLRYARFSKTENTNNVNKVLNISIIDVVLYL